MKVCIFSRWLMSLLTVYARKRTAVIKFASFRLMRLFEWSNTFSVYRIKSPAYYTSTNTTFPRAFKTFFVSEKRVCFLMSLKLSIWGIVGLLWYALPIPLIISRELLAVWIIFEIKFVRFTLKTIDASMVWFHIKRKQIDCASLLIWKQTTLASIVFNVMHMV